MTADDARQFLGEVKSSTDPLIARFLQQVHSKLVVKANITAESAGATPDSLGDAASGIVEGAGVTLDIIGDVLNYIEYAPVLNYYSDPGNPSRQKAFQKWMEEHPNDPQTTIYHVQHPNPIL